MKQTKITRNVMVMGSVLAQVSMMLAGLAFAEDVQYPFPTSSNQTQVQDVKRAPAQEQSQTTTETTTEAQKMRVDKIERYLLRKP